MTNQKKSFTHQAFATFHRILEGEREDVLQIVFKRFNFGANCGLLLQAVKKMKQERIFSMRGVLRQIDLPTTTSFFLFTSNSDSSLSCCCCCFVSFSSSWMSILSHAQMLGTRSAHSRNSKDGEELWALEVFINVKLPNVKALIDIVYLVIFEIVFSFTNYPAEISVHKHVILSALDETFRRNSMGGYNFFFAASKKLFGMLNYDFVICYLT